MAPPERANGQPSDREVEWQLDAVDLRPVRRWLEAMPPNGLAVEHLGVRSLHDRYLDTDDWRLHRAGYTLRIRTASRRSEATAKSRGTVAEGLRDRRELTEPLSAGDPHAVASAPGPVGELVRSMAGSRPLELLFEVRTRRRAYSLAVDGRPVGEVALDDTSIPVDGGRPARLQRVEIEIDPAAVDAVAPLIDELRTACGLHPATASKFQAGLLASGLAPPPPLDLGTVEIDESMTVGELAFAVLRTQFRELLSHEPEARLGEDPEGVHSMRVAIRRMRAAISAFREVLPVRAQRLRDEFKWLAGVLGEVRDLDVQLEQVAEWGSGLPEEDRAALEPLVATFEERRAAARSAMLQHLDSRRFERMMAGMSEMLVRGPLRRSAASRTPALVAGPDLVRRRYRKVRSGSGMPSSSSVRCIPSGPTGSSAGWWPSRTTWGGSRTPGWPRTTSASWWRARGSRSGPCSCSDGSASGTRPRRPPSGRSSRRCTAVSGRGGGPACARPWTGAGRRSWPRCPRRVPLPWLPPRNPRPRTRPRTPAPTGPPGA